MKAGNGSTGQRRECRCDGDRYSIAPVKGERVKAAIRVVVGLLGLSACATVGQMDDGPNTLSGQDAGTAVQVLGKPSAQRTDGGYTVYAWTVARAETRTPGGQGD